MSEPEKLTKSKDVIAYLTEQFPECFSIKGDAKPLKIGIFEDLAKRLENDDKVSKTRLRTALRHYTNSWRYLHSIKAGSQRVDLDGKSVEAVTEEHQQHAQETLKESKAKVAEKNKASAKANAKKAPAKKKAEGAGKPKSKPTKKANKPEVKLADVELNNLSVGQQVQVKAGNTPMSATILELDKDDVQVQLQNGLTMKVKADKIFLRA
ncbi:MULTISPECIES: RNA chaperone ProQ [Idiomarina]|jgi:ProP effector|uniref:RNA chaperone ProQ n=1 Tax=Idiomarina abyssalis TaxID=86102 RepID=A0A8I1GAH3_9GAMM|nr:MULTISPECIES: RNA chaperone ProQ [Idiomarina]KPD22646.1 prop expression regulator [Idiomarina abyssalis]MAL82742.1 RNA chaperone ProQ [Idiomarina sp.]MBE93218.1 RNA chaperone ProQ [Idiomarina sp.]MBJ7267489.1 RNA chaperone ProQ [Idiomarina abyssalis]MBJ7274602.1 RNA chaperone ProQ [Idiomarina abyssalis]|tara:strand:+ start:1829 stop:2455 length:627 start_codon:yes stop_codon:yes gene_type:complete